MTSSTSPAQGGMFWCRSLARSIQISWAAWPVFYDGIKNTYLALQGTKETDKLLVLMIYFILGKQEISFRRLWMRDCLSSAVFCVNIKWWLPFKKLKSPVQRKHFRTTEVCTALCSYVFL